MTTRAGAEQPKQRKKEVPEYLIRDEIDGELFYYAGYQDVLNNKKTAEEIMACSGLQSWIISFLMKIFYTQIGDEKYQPLSNEVRSHLGKKNNLGLDFAFFDKTILTPDKITTRYVDVPPVLSIEIDVRVDTNNLTEMDFVHKKTKKLLEKGVSKVIWIFTRSQRVLIATPEADWLNVDWNRDIELLDGHTFNLGKAIQEAGIKIEEV
ncbi:MAG: Uma2 family endonuclease [Saprospiraceae bacterium]